MYPHIYAGESAKEMERAAAERQMGCSPLCRMISRVIMKCNGREGRTRNERLDYAMAYPPAQTCYVRPTARTVTCTTSNHPASAQAITAQPPHVHRPLPATPFATTAGAPPRASGKPRRRKKSKSKHVQLAPGGPVPAGAAHAYQHAAPAGTRSGTASGDQHHHNPAVSEPYSPAANGQGYGYDRYAASPLTRWEMLGAAGTPRRHEYFSGEYRWYYPTPVREGIYSIATDANRLTTIFSEENPNACTIV